MTNRPSERVKSALAWRLKSRSRLSIASGTCPRPLTSTNAATTRNRLGLPAPKKSSMAPAPKKMATDNTTATIMLTVNATATRSVCPFSCSKMSEAPMPTPRRMSIQKTNVRAMPTTPMPSAPRTLVAMV